MNKITPIPTKKTEKELWSDFVKKSKIAQDTLSLKDGLEARRSWVRFMGEFNDDK